MTDEEYLIFMSDKSGVLPVLYKYINNGKFTSDQFDSETSTLHFDKLEASEFRLYELKRA